MFSRKATEILTVTIIVLLLAAAGVYLAVQLRPPGGRYPYSSYGTDRRGVKALFLLLAETGHPVDRWENPPDALERQGKGTVLVLVEPSVRRVSTAGAEALRRWVESGNRLLLLGTGQDRLLEELGLTAESGFPPSRKIVSPRAEHPLLANVQTVDLNTAAYFLPAGDSLALLAEDDRVFALLKNIGQGELLAIADAGIITNGAIASEDNLIFILNALHASPPSFGEPLPVLFDEFHHGFGPLSSSLLERTLPDGAIIWPLAQLGLFTLLVLLTVGKRFVAPRRPAMEFSPSGGEMVNAAGAFYAKAGADRLALQILYRGLRRSIIKKFRLPAAAGPAELAAAVGRYLGEEAANLEVFFNRLESAVQRPGPLPEMAELAGRLTRYRKEF